MATKIYDIDTIALLDGTSIRLTPLKIIHLREFMNVFGDLQAAKNDYESIEALSGCAIIAMRQYCPAINTIEKLEDATDLKILHQIVDTAAGISTKQNSKNNSLDSSEQTEGGSWDSLDLAKLEAEVFLLGIWKDYQDLEASLSMPELVATLESKRELDYQEKKFFAAIQGVDLDEQTGNKKENAWEAMKARVFSGGQTNDSNDIIAYQGANAQKAGFGIGMGLSYERID